jgi:hypothetical protein
MAEWLKRDPSDVAVIEPAVNTHMIQQVTNESIGFAKRRFGLDRKYMVWSGRGVPYKNAKLAGEAVSAIKHPVDIIGFGSPRFPQEDSKLHRYIEAADVDDMTKYSILQGASVVLCPSLFEGYGMVPGEAIASGVPCVAYDLPVYREAYGERLIYAEWNKPSDFKKKVKETFEQRLVAEEGGRTPPQIVPDFLEAQDSYGLDQMEKRVTRVPEFCFRKRRVSVQLIAYWGFIPEALESVYDHADEVLVAFGPTPEARKIDDGSLKLLKEFPDPQGKLRFEIREEWRDKLEMRSWCLENSRGNYHILLDGDEIWSGLDQWFEADIPFGCPRWVNFWHGPDQYVVDYPGNTHRWGKPLEGGGSVCPHYRCSHLRSSYAFRTHPVLVDKHDHPLHQVVSDSAEKVPGCRIYHLGHSLPKDVMAAKHDYYLKRDGSGPAREKRKRAWHQWNGQLGDCGDGIIKAVDWPLPDLVERAFDRLKSSQVGRRTGARNALRA